jgi:three-Cys-motif partner protein
MTEASPRAWGYWTQAKLQMLADYLGGFATASKGQSERIYLDAFAGETTGVDRLTGEEFPGSARIALEAGDSAGFTKFRYFELDRRRAHELEGLLRADYPGRDIRVYEGDCNVTIPQALADLRHLNWAPTFAFLDPDGSRPRRWCKHRHRVIRAEGYATAAIGSITSSRSGSLASS